MDLSREYSENVRVISTLLRANESFDIIERRLAVSDRQICFFYIDGFVKDGELQGSCRPFYP
jgi:stage V sporulation protein AF